MRKCPTTILSSERRWRRMPLMEWAKYWQHGAAVVALAAFCLAKPTLCSPQAPLGNFALPQAGQTTAASGSVPTAQLVPQNARELLLAAAQVNGLDSPGLKPWHILVSYEKFDGGVNTADRGSYEEFWVAPNQYRLSYTSRDITQTDIATEKALYRTGADGWPSQLQIEVRDEFVRPMFREMNLQFAKPERKMLDFGKGEASLRFAAPVRWRQLYSSRQRLGSLLPRA